MAVEPSVGIFGVIPARRGAPPAARLRASGSLARGVWL